MEATGGSGIMVDPEVAAETARRPALDELAELGAGELTRLLEQALPGVGARAVSPFNSSV
ncbi:hypothetical protein [Kitasatospora sp. NPDC093806]|uniref:hypothetical protein n=1 Tax=Kitasatospora sp. NPDC093806 TaxID=3155075 RepID=UPI003412FB62